ncbi:hypothetical protein [Colwellia sp. BRX10-4]|jgi:hypothetical protein|uniref:hypothetical protein n=1 Tax=Colwellia sp. BRX10-4 TaxID=2759843 RepID=UPI0015F3FB6C|nr:hypothetical protein [Colwellia sp. BRX10-4]MBA6398932.1 hypothetical protein [Colwellia sp. BRX10-4]
MFSGLVTIMVFMIGGAIAFSYKKPAAYRLLMNKFFDWLGFIAFGALCLCSGMDLTVRHFEIDIKDFGVYSYLIPEFRYLWVIPLACILLYFSFSALGRLTQELQSTEE